MVGSSWAQNDGAASKVAAPAGDLPGSRIGEVAPALTLSVVRGELPKIDAGTMLVLELAGPELDSGRTKAIAALVAAQQGKLRAVLVLSGGVAGATAESAKAAAEADKSGLPVAFDADGVTATAMLSSQNASWWPRAVLVDGSGRIAWIGPRVSALKAVVEAAGAGAFDIDAMKKDVLDSERAAVLRAAKDNRRASEIALRLLGAKPELFRHCAEIRYDIMMDAIDTYAAVAYAEGIVKGAAKDDPEALMAIAQISMRRGGHWEDTTKLAQSALDRAKQLMGEESPRLMALMARALECADEPQKAVEMAKKALAVYPPGPSRAALEEDLKEYEKSATPRPRKR